MTARLRESDICARYGGEEFAILLPETSYENGVAVCEDIRLRVESYPFEGDETQPFGKVTISLGVAAYPDHSEDPLELLKKADEVLYRAKRDGRNRVVGAGDP